MYIIYSLFEFIQGEVNTSFFFWQLGKEWGSLSKISYISNINAL